MTPLVIAFFAVVAFLGGIGIIVFAPAPKELALGKSRGLILDRGTRIGVFPLAALFVGLLVGLLTNVWGFAVVLAVLAFVAKPLFTVSETKKRAAVLAELEGWVRSLSGILGAGGRSIESALVESVAVCPPGLRPQVQIMADQVAAGFGVEGAVRLWAKECNDAQVDMVAAVLIMESQQRSGSVSQSLKELATLIGSASKRHRALNVERTSILQSIRAVTVIGLAMIVWMVFFTPFIEIYRTFTGSLVLVLAGIIFAGGLLWMRSLIKERPRGCFLEEGQS